LGYGRHIECGGCRREAGLLSGTLSGAFKGWTAAQAARPEVAAKAAKSGIQILEREGNTVIASFKVAKGEARVIAEVMREGDTLFLRGAHIEGQGTMREAIQAARAFGQEQGAKRVIIEGGIRTTGANPGHTPRPITVETGL